MIYLLCLVLFIVPLAVMSFPRNLVFQEVGYNLD